MLSRLHGGVRHHQKQNQKQNQKKNSSPQVRLERCRPLASSPMYYVAARIRDPRTPGAGDTSYAPDEPSPVNPATRALDSPLKDRLT